MWYETPWRREQGCAPRTAPSRHPLGTVGRRRQAMCRRTDVAREGDDEAWQAGSGQSDRLLCRVGRRHGRHHHELCARPDSVAGRRSAKPAGSAADTGDTRRAVRRSTRSVRPREGGSRAATGSGWGRRRARHESRAEASGRRRQLEVTNQASRAHTSGLAASAAAAPEALRHTGRCRRRRISAPAPAASVRYDHGQRRCTPTASAATHRGGGRGQETRDSASWRRQVHGARGGHCRGTASCQHRPRLGDAPARNAKANAATVEVTVTSVPIAQRRRVRPPALRFRWNATAPGFRRSARSRAHPGYAASGATIQVWLPGLS